MAFGLCNSPATYARVINLVLGGLTWRVVFAFLDDILVLGKTMGGHLENLEVVCRRFREYGHKLKPQKFEMLKQEVEYLGWVIGSEGMRIGPGYIADVLKWPVPTSLKDVKRFFLFCKLPPLFHKRVCSQSKPIGRRNRKEGI